MAKRSIKYPTTHGDIVTAEDWRETLNYAQNELKPVRWRMGDLVRIRANWEKGGMYCMVLGEAIYRSSHWWVPVLEQGEEDPTWHKLEGLEKA